MSDFLSLKPGTIVYEVSLRPFFPGEKAIKYEVLELVKDKTIGDHLRLQNCEDPQQISLGFDWFAETLEVWSLTP